MSSWMTSGKARLNARQNRTFEKHAQQRARVTTGNNGNGTEPQRILRERVHPNANYQPEAARGAKRDRSGTIEIISGDLGEFCMQNALEYLQFMLGFSEILGLNEIEFIDGILLTHSRFVGFPLHFNCAIH